MRLSQITMNSILTPMLKVQENNNEEREQRKIAKNKVVQ